MPKTSRAPSRRRSTRTASPPSTELWRCADCGRRFANRNQSHACGTYSLDRHFAGRPDGIAALYHEFVRTLRGFGPVTVLPEKTRIALQVRMSFAQLTPRSRWIDGHVVLARPVPAACVRKVESFSARNHVHYFRLATLDDISDELRALLREGYAVGEQRHLQRRVRASPVASSRAAAGKD